MTYRLFIDDEREPPNDGHDWVVARSSYEAIRIVAQKEIPTFISFDHDLGGNDTSMVFLKWLADACLEYRRGFTFEYYVHSQNPIGKENIEGFIKSFRDFYPRME